MKFELKKYWQIVLTEGLIILAFILFYGKFGDLFVDSFREAYIPAQIIKGKILYKDIFCIYPPFAYLFNALLFLIFGIKLKVLYFAGLFATMGIFYFTYRIAEKFFKSILPLGICLFMVSGLVLSPNVFNAFFPYSYGMLYGILFILVSIYFALNKRFPISYLFYSLAICSKYEFILLLPLLILFSKKTDWKKNLIALILPLIVILLLCRCSISDFKTTFDLINIMSGTKTLYWFYSVMGLTFRPELIPIYITNIIKFIIPVSWNSYQEILIWAYPVILILFAARFKKISKEERFFIGSSLLISVKVFFALTLQSYGVFFLPFALISLFILTPQKFRKVLFILIIIWSFVIGIQNTNMLIKKDMTKLDKTVEYIKTNTTVDEKVVVYPECLGINVLSERVSDNKFYSLIPLYVETFGEDLIIKRLEITKPEYIILSDYDTSAYYFRTFGEDYGVEIKKWIEQNYILIKNIDGFKIFTHQASPSHVLKYFCQSF